MSTTQYDAIFIGSGHNALIAAAYLARAGWSVLVLEQNDRPGGLVRTEEVTLPGFHHDLYSAAHPLFVTGPAYAELGAELTARGLTYLNTDLPTGVSMADGRTAVFARDMAANFAEVERLAPGDSAALAHMLESFGPYAGDVFSLFAMDLSSPQGQKTIHKLLHAEDGKGYSTFAAMLFQTARQAVSGFRSPVTQAMLAPWVMHLGRTPDEVASGAWVPLAVMAMAGGGMAFPQGGSEKLAQALARLITDHGGTIRTHTRAARIQVKHGKAVAARDLLPAEHVVDAGYMSATTLLASAQQGVDLIGPVGLDSSWQAHAQQGFDSASFTIDWAAQSATCPQGKQSRHWKERLKRGTPTIEICFASADCGACPVRSQCLKQPTQPRHLNIRAQDHYQVLRSARQRQQTVAFRQKYKRRAGIEGTISQAVRTCNARRTRYIGQAKTHLQELAAAVGLNLARLADWFEPGFHPETVRVSPFGRLAPATG